MSCAGIQERITTLYKTAFARPPRSEELEDARTFLGEQASAYALMPEQILGSRDLWADLCHVLFNTKEFIFLN